MILHPQAVRNRQVFGYVFCVSGTSFHIRPRAKKTSDKADTQKSTGSGIPLAERK